MNYREFLIFRNRAALYEPQEPEVLSYVTWRNLESVQAWRTRLRGCSTLASECPPHSLLADLLERPHGRVEQ